MTQEAGISVRAVIEVSPLPAAPDATAPKISTEALAEMATRRAHNVAMVLERKAGSLSAQIAQRLEEAVADLEHPVVTLEFEPDDPAFVARLDPPRQGALSDQNRLAAQLADAVRDAATARIHEVATATGQWRVEVATTELRAGHAAQHGGIPQWAWIAGAIAILAIAVIGLALD